MSDLVSCLMVTGCDPIRESFGRAVVRSFQQQTYESKELVIINQSLGTPWEYCLTENEPDITEILVPKAATLGDARNMALEVAEGSWLISADDDDWSAPYRLELQMAQRQGNKPVLPNKYTTYSFVYDTAYIYRQPVCCGLMLFPASAKRYASKGQGDDWSLTKQFPEQVVWDNPADMYYRFHHGKNTWDTRHIMREHWKQEHGRFLPPEDTITLETLLAKEYSWARALIT